MAAFDSTRETVAVETPALFAPLVVLRVAEEHGVAFGVRGFLDALENQREERA